jgi:hypothetical protein
MIHKLTKLLSLVGILIVLLVQFLTPVAASAENGQALSISPPVIELQGEAGKSVTATIKVTNISNADLLIKNQVNDFGAKNETGEPNIIFDYTQESSYSLHSWVTAPPPFVLGSKQSKQVQFQINVPSDAEPGGHYAVFRFTGQAPELQETGVAISASIGSLVLLKIGGNLAEKASLVEYYSATPSFAKSSFFETGPINFVERIRNDGNIHIKPTGTIEVSDMFGRNAGTLRVNGDPTNPQDPPRSILPQSIRRFQQTLNTKWMFGRYTAKMKLTYGSTGIPLESTTTFWVIPYKLILLVLLSAVILFFLIRFLIRRYNQHIIKLAQTSQANTTQAPHTHSASSEHQKPATGHGRPHSSSDGIKKPPKK